MRRYWPIVLFVVCILVVVLMPHRAAKQDIPITDKPGIWMDYGNLVQRDEECIIENWENIITFELRKNGEIVASQNVLSPCEVVCRPESEQICDAVTFPSEWEVFNGEYDVFWKSVWRNKVSGNEYPSYPDGSVLDERGFIYLGATTVVSGSTIYLPVIRK